MSEDNDSQTGEALPRPQLSLYNRWWMSFIGAFLLTTASIGIVATGLDVAARFGLESKTPIPDGTYAIAFAVLWVIATGACMLMLRRFRGTATANKRGVDVDLEV